MATITEDYVSSEIARQLKEKGFNEQCFTYYDNTNDSINRFDKGYHFNNTSYPWGVPYNINNAKKYVCAPTLQMAMKWLREVHKLQIQIAPIVSRHKDWTFGIYKEFSPLTIDLLCFPTYEEACEAACVYALKNLV